LADCLETNENEKENTRNPINIKNSVKINICNHFIAEGENFSKLNNSTVSNEIPNISRYYYHYYYIDSYLILSWFN